MNQLERLFEHYRTDKGRNGYSGLYECLFHGKREEISSLLEIGIGTMIPGMCSTMVGIVEDYKTGASLRAWRDYFPNATIYGMDIQPDTQFSEHRICTMQADSRSPDDVKRVMSEKNVTQVDIVIDDGSHSHSDQMATLAIMMNHVKPGGTYIIEDIYTPSPADYMAMVRSVAGDLPMFMISPGNNICVIANPIRGTYTPQ